MACRARGARPVKTLEHLETGHDRQVDTAQQEVWRFSEDCVFAAIACGAHFETLLDEFLGNQRCDLLIVLDKLCALPASQA
jgi:hypothetical protein